MPGVDKVLRQTVAHAPPNNLDIEAAILGAVMKKPEVFPDLSVVLAADHFYSPNHQAIWSAFADLSMDGTAIDMITVHEDLERKGMAQRVNSPMALVNIVDSVASTANVETWAGELKEYYKRRRAISLGLRLVESGYDMTAPPADSAVEAQGVLDEILEDRLRVRDQNPAEYVHEWIDYIEKLKAFSETRIKSPFYGLNSLVGGFFPGEVAVLAARPGMGKTAFALNVIEYGLKKGKKCAMFSLEMTRFALTNRMCASGRILGSGKGLDAQKFRTGEFEDDDWSRIYEFASALQGVNFRVWDRSSVKPSEIRGQSRIWRREMGGLDLLVVDYLQLVEPESRGASREREMSDVSRMLKKTALELEVPILVLAQLNRAAEQSKKPLLSHLRESGAIEQDADMVLFLWPKDKDQKKRDDQNEDGPPPTEEVDLIAAKGRGNRTGTVPLVYLRNYLQFVNPAAEG